MMSPGHPLAKLLRRDKRFSLEAYVFVFEALNYAQEVLRMGSSETPESEERHLTGQELCEAIRQFSIEQFGLLAKTVLNHWGVYDTGDFGQIVFNLIDIGQMRKTENDRREDFDCVFDFDEGLRRDFKITVPRRSEERPG